MCSLTYRESLSLFPDVSLLFSRVLGVNGSAKMGGKQTLDFDAVKKASWEFFFITGDRETFVRFKSVYQYLCLPESLYLFE